MLHPKVQVVNANPDTKVHNLPSLLVAALLVAALLVAALLVLVLRN
jgi:hypothetical protein